MNNFYYGRYSADADARADIFIGFDNGYDLIDAFNVGIANMTFQTHYQAGRFIFGRYYGFRDAGEFIYFRNIICEAGRRFKPDFEAFAIGEPE